MATMKKGEVCMLTCAPEYAYGASGSPPKIPANATLKFEVELFYWKDLDVTNDGGVIKRVLTQGEGWKNPKEEASVTSKWNCSLITSLFIKWSLSNITSFVIIAILHV